MPRSRSADVSATGGGSPPTSSLTSDGSAARVPACGALLLPPAAGRGVGAMDARRRLSRLLEVPFHLRGVAWLDGVEACHAAFERQLAAAEEMAHALGIATA